MGYMHVFGNGRYVSCSKPRLHCHKHPWKERCVNDLKKRYINEEQFKLQIVSHHKGSKFKESLGNHRIIPTAVNMDLGECKREIFDQNHEGLVTTFVSVCKYFITLKSINKFINL